MPVAPSDLPSWLLSPEEQTAPEFDADLLDAIATGTMPAVPAGETPAAVSEHLAALTQPSSPDDIDSWAEALDEEFERRQAGDESVPDWYMEALSRAEGSLDVTATPRVSEPEVSAPSVSDSAMPDWLREEPEQPAEAIQGEIPDWLRNVAGAPSAPVSVPEPTASAVPQAPVTSDDSWLTADATPAELPDWLKPAPVVEAAPTPPPVQQAPPAAPPPAKPAATPSRPAVVPPRVTTPTGAPSPQHEATLKQARSLVASGQHADSLQHYQSLIDQSQYLEETRADLRQLADSQPKDPRVRRLLVDTHMRLGDLQAALDTYRSALDQL
jgi:hypothetical protein